jgi:hypothetical protein
MATTRRWTAASTLSQRPSSYKERVKRTRTIFHDLVGDIAPHAPGLRCRLSRGPSADFPNERNFAMCGLVGPRDAKIVVAPKIEREPDAVIHALLRHELAHAVLLFCGHADHSERAADALAEAMWGDRINYDGRDVQTLAPGKHPRPGHLHR